MARILAYTTPARGHLFPITPVLGALRSRGHDVALRTLGSEVERMNRLGLAARPIAPALESLPHDDFRARSTQAAVKRALATFADRAPLDAADLQEAIEQERPDALLVDINAWGAAAAAEAWGGPWASWCPYPLPVPSRDVPPFGPGLRPARGLATRPGSAWTWSPDRAPRSSKLRARFWAQRPGPTTSDQLRLGTAITNRALSYLA